MDVLLAAQIQQNLQSLVKSICYPYYYYYYPEAHKSSTAQSGDVEMRVGHVKLTTNPYINSTSL